jgi:hypothetical protein
MSLLLSRASAAADVTLTTTAIAWALRMDAPTLQLMMTPTAGNVQYAVPASEVKVDSITTTGIINITVPVSVITIDAGGGRGPWKTLQGVGT